MFYVVKLIFMFYRPHNCQMRAKIEVLKDKTLIDKEIKQKEGITEKKPFQNERVSIKIEKVHCMIRSSSGTICFNQEKPFPQGETRVPRHGTCFPDMEHFVPRQETFSKLNEKTDYIPYSSILR